MREPHVGLSVSASSGSLVTNPVASAGAQGSSISVGGGQILVGSSTANSVSAGFKPPQQMQQQHAISYVTTIRNRFANEPETYRLGPQLYLHSNSFMFLRAFLKILHTYQKEQKGIKDVLEQVRRID